MILSGIPPKIAPGILSGIPRGTLSRIFLGISPGIEFFFSITTQGFLTAVISSRVSASIPPEIPSKIPLGCR